MKKNSGIDADRALKKLLDGNKRYVWMKATHPHQTKRHINALEKGQHPFAVIVGCSDSRVAPEIIFDQGLGDFFVVRAAGHVVGETGMGSIEYAVYHLGVQLVVVLGHEGCGAVTAAVEGVEGGMYLSKVLKPIKTAVKKAETLEGDTLHNAVGLNVLYFVRKLESSEVFAGLIKSGKLKIAGARYDMHTHMVELI